MHRQTNIWKNFEKVLLRKSWTHQTTKLWYSQAGAVCQADYLIHAENNRRHACNWSKVICKNSANILQKASALNHANSNIGIRVGQKVKLTNIYNTITAEGHAIIFRPSVNTLKLIKLIKYELRKFHSFSFPLIWTPKNFICSCNSLYMN